MNSNCAAAIKAATIDAALAKEGWPALLTKRESAKVLRCTPRTIERRVAERRLATMNMAHGGRVLIERAELARFIASLSAA